MPLSIRLDTETDSALEDIAERHSQTKSDVVRRAIRELIHRERVTPYEMVEDLIGCVSGGPEDLSSRTGEKFGEILLENRPDLVPGTFHSRTKHFSMQSHSNYEVV